MEPDAMHHASMPGTTRTEGSRWNADDNLPEKSSYRFVASGEYETGFQIKAVIHGAEMYETTSYPIDKKADGEDEIGTVSQGKKIRFTLSSVFLAACTLCCDGIQRLTGKLRKGDSQSPRTQCVRRGNSPRIQRVRCGIVSACTVHSVQEERERKRGQLR
ncbi:hypothetical protein ACI3EW_00995 [Pilosibacter sp. HC1M1C21]|uniref:hypothetical protein n=1 Tax=Pilosibacter sp. HC1M1C21 TaxID=3378803 RepID=UPI0038585F4B